MTKPKITVSKYLEQQLAVCGRSQRDVATDTGYTNPNIMTMFKNGSTKVPVNKIAPLAKALGVDPVHFIRLALSEYVPEMWDAIEDVLGKQNLLAEQDYALVGIVNEAASGVPIDWGITGNRKILSDAIVHIAQMEQAKAKASVERMDTLPPNSRNK